MKTAILWGGAGLVIAAGLLFVLSFVGSPTNPSGNTNGTGEPLNPPVSETDHIKGNAEASVVFVEYGDLQCPACAQYAPLMARVIEDFGDDVAVVWRHFPLRQIHFNAESSARASEAAARQGKFWEMHDILFERQNDWARESNPKDKYIEYAVEIGLDRDQFVTDLEDGALATLIQEDFESAVTQGLNGTPSFFFQGQRIANPQSYDEVRQLILAALENGDSEPESTENTSSGSE